MLLVDKHKLFLQSLDKELVAAVTTYTTYEYKTINTELRSGRSLSLKTQRVVNQIDNVFEMVDPITEPLVLYKGIKNDNLKPDNAFISTSYDKDVALGFAGHKCCLVVFTVPIGSKVLFVESVSASPEELEVLINRDGNFAIINVVKARLGEKDIINVGYIPPKSVEVKQKDLEYAIESAMDQMSIIQHLVNSIPADEYDLFGDDDEFMSTSIKNIYQTYKKANIQQSMLENVISQLKDKFKKPTLE